MGILMLLPWSQQGLLIKGLHDQPHDGSGRVRSGTAL